jgi:hypothetical protein
MLISFESFFGFCSITLYIPSLTNILLGEPNNLARVYLYHLNLIAR